MDDSPLKEICREISKLTDSTVISIAMNESLHSGHLYKLNECLEALEFGTLYVVLHSGGGDVNAAYQIAELLRSRCKKMNVVVPLYAKSAATLFTISADEIIMHELAELGPLDTQIIVRERGIRQYESALNLFKTLEQLQTFSLKTMDHAAQLILHRTDLMIDEAISQSIEFASRISHPLYTQITVKKLGEYNRALAIVKEYGKRLLDRYKKWDDEQIDEVLTQLVYGYPSHDYVIDFKEMKDLGFDVRHPTEGEKILINQLIDILIELDGTEIFCINENKFCKNQEVGMDNGKIKNTNSKSKDKPKKEEEYAED